MGFRVNYNLVDKVKLDNILNNEIDIFTQEGISLNEVVEFYEDIYDVNSNEECTDSTHYKGVEKAKLNSFFNERKNEYFRFFFKRDYIFTPDFYETLNDLNLDYKNPNKYKKLFNDSDGYANIVYKEGLEEIINIMSRLIGETYALNHENIRLESKINHSIEMSENDEYNVKLTYDEIEYISALLQNMSSSSVTFFRDKSIDFSSSFNMISSNRYEYTIWSFLNLYKNLDWSKYYLIMVGG